MVSVPPVRFCWASTLRCDACVRRLSGRRLNTRDLDRKHGSPEEEDIQGQEPEPPELGVEARRAIAQPLPPVQCISPSAPCLRQLRLV